MMQSVRRMLGIAIAAIAALVVVGSATAVPARQAAGKMTFCSDITYPPEEFYSGSKPVGSDIDIGTGSRSASARPRSSTTPASTGSSPRFWRRNATRSSAGMNDTPERRKQVDFVDYLRVGQSLMVKKGNPKHISEPRDRCRARRVSVEVGTTNKDFLDATSKKLKAAGKAAIKVSPSRRTRTPRRR